MNALFISAEAPYPLAGGGALRSASLLHFLARNHAVDMIAFREPRAADPGDHLPSGLVRRLHVVDLPAHARHPLARAMRNAGRLARRVPPLVDRFAGLGDRIAAAIHGQRYDLAIIEHFWCAPYVEQIARISDATILDLHNIESVLHASYAAAAGAAQALAHRRFEKSCRNWKSTGCRDSPGCLAASEPDAERVRSYLTGRTSAGLSELHTVDASAAAQRRRCRRILRQSGISTEYLRRALLSARDLAGATGAAGRDWFGG